MGAAARVPGWGMSCRSPRSERGASTSHMCWARGQRSSSGHGRPSACALGRAGPRVQLSARTGDGFPARRGSRCTCGPSGSGTRRGASAAIYGFDLPVVMGRRDHTPRHRRNCQQCDAAVVGDEPHMILSVQQCSTFATRIRTCSGTGNPWVSSSTRQTRLLSWILSLLVSTASSRVISLAEGFEGFLPRGWHPFSPSGLATGCKGSKLLPLHGVTLISLHDSVIFGSQRLVYAYSQGKSSPARLPQNADRLAVEASSTHHLRPAPSHSVACSAVGDLEPEPQVGQQPPRRGCLANSAWYRMHAMA